MFDSRAQEQLSYYVYALFDPARPNWPFYVGKGVGNRVFSHAAGELPDNVAMAETEPLSLKAQQIDNIKRSGRQVIHKIIRYGLTEEGALSVEAALIDIVNHICPDTLTNQVSGHGIAEGMIDAVDLATALQAEPLQTTLPVLLIKIERRWSRLLDDHGAAHQIPSTEILEAVRGNWKISIRRANKARYVLAVARGLVRGAYVAQEWRDSDEKGRKRFSGIVSSEPHLDFIGKSVTAHFKRGGQNPVRYLNC